MVDDALNADSMLQRGEHRADKHGKEGALVQEELPGGAILDTLLHLQNEESNGKSDEGMAMRGER